MTQHDDALQTAGLAVRENWRAAAACRFADPDLFFPISDSGKGLDQAAEAKAICAGAGCAARAWLSRCEPGRSMGSGAA